MKLNRLAFIGVRGHYDWVLRSLAKVPQVEVVGLCDAGSESMRPLTEWCRTRGFSPGRFTDHNRMLRETAPDAVVLCGPIEHHAAMATDAIRQGIHLLIEKPAALTIDELDRLQTLHDAHPGVHLATMQTGRFFRGFYTAWHLVREGAIGDVRLINARKSYKLGTRPDFFRDRDTYGGTIPWVGSHAIDWMLWIGGHRVRSVYATHTSAGKTSVGTMEQSALCHFTLCGDRYASVSIDVLRPENARTHGDDWLRIVGTEGVMEVTADSVNVVNAGNDGSKSMPLRTPPTIFEDFHAMVEGRNAGLVSAHDTFATTAACLLARQSADEGRPLEAEAFTSIAMKSKSYYVNGSRREATAVVA